MSEHWKVYEAVVNQARAKYEAEYARALTAMDIAAACAAYVRAIEVGWDAYAVAIGAIVSADWRPISFEGWGNG